ncbi:conserved hypothetical protein [Flavobacterium sp. 9R]|uniref:hypothetical protein n=1 Tax=Flavobacterium sp. 9R TaxID=2653143 RepID=UPI0012F3F85A|nr:hypothetical protein [Flavobacterium sp. 9R]VXB74137.1 conserved hypothetical protein [Flavobacterium sp. 9R]
MFSLFHKKSREFSKTESHIFGIISELLKRNSTDIHCDELGRKYYLSNEDHHIRVTIFSNDYVIRITNTHDSIAEKYDDFLINKLVLAIKEEKQKRMDLICGSISDSIENMAERLHKTLTESVEKDSAIIKMLKTN